VTIIVYKGENPYGIEVKHERTLHSHVLTTKTPSGMLASVTIYDDGRLVREYEVPGHVRRGVLFLGEHLAIDEVMNKAMGRIRDAEKESET